MPQRSVDRRSGCNDSGVHPSLTGGTGNRCARGHAPRLQPLHETGAAREHRADPHASAVPDSRWRPKPEVPRRAARPFRCGGGSVRHGASRPSFSSAVTRDGRFPYASASECSALAPKILGLELWIQFRSTERLGRVGGHTVRSLLGVSSTVMVAERVSKDLIEPCNDSLLIAEVSRSLDHFHESRLKDVFRVCFGSDPLLQRGEEQAVVVEERRERFRLRDAGLAHRYGAFRSGLAAGPARWILCS